jgi:predicted AAA+ superfamily ATPase
MSRLESPLTTLDPLTGLVVIDEIQRMPELFPLLRVLADRRPLPARFLILGSASPDLLQKSAETLAGRIELIEMGGLSIGETGADRLFPLWVRGAFPPAYLAKSDEDSFDWRENFIQTFLERDLGQIGINVPSCMMRRLWMMLAHYHGAIWNASEIARSMGFSYMTINRYVDALAGAYMVRRVPPWFENMKKRQVKAPKIYIRDSGILHTLLGIRELRDLQSHPKLGASWEGFVIEQLITLLGERNLYFWATHSGAELDILYTKEKVKVGFEIKYADAPRLTKAMKIAIHNLSLNRLYIIYPGTQTYSLDERIHAISVADIPKELP